MNGVIIKEEKETLRNKIRLLRQDIFSKNIQLYSEYSNEIIKKIIDFKPFTLSSNIAFFASKELTFEPKTDEIINFALKKRDRVYLPRCISGTNDMDFIEINNLKLDTEIGSFHLREPKKELMPKNQGDIIQSLDLMLVPGMAFDIFGNRLGYGMGYYDNFLSKLRDMNPKCLVIGLAFDFQVFNEEIPHDGRDIVLDYIITPSNIHIIRH